MSLLIVQLILLVLATVFAWIFADWPERAVPSAFLATLVVDQLAHMTFVPLDDQRVVLWHILLEAVLTGFLLLVSLRAERFWPLFVVSAQGVALIAQLLFFAGFETQGLVGAILVRSPTWLAIGLTIFAIARLHLARSKPQTT